MSNQTRLASAPPGKVAHPQAHPQAHPPRRITGETTNRSRFRLRHLGWGRASVTPQAAMPTPDSIAPTVDIQVSDVERGLLRLADLPIINPSAFVYSNTFFAFSGELISPLAIIGIRTLCLILAMVSYSTLPLNRHSLVLPCTVSKETPQSSAILASSTPFLVAGHQPVLIFSVTGISTLLTTDSNIAFTSLGSFSKAEPAAFFNTFLTYHYRNTHI